MPIFSKFEKIPTLNASSKKFFKAKFWVFLTKNLNKKRQIK